MGQPFILPAQIMGAERLGRRAPSADYPAISETQDGGILVQAGSGMLDIVLDSLPYQGSYSIDPAALASGPVSLVPPAITGTAAVGQTLTGKPGLWSHDGTLAAPVLSWQWLRDGAPIEGATGMEHVLTAPDSGKAISLAETAQDAHGTAQAVSAPLVLPTPLVPTQRAKANGSTSARVFAGLSLGAPAPMRDIVVLAAAIGTAGAAITSVKVAGIAATRLTQTLSGGSAVVCIGAWMARVPAGATGTVELLTSANTTTQHVALFRGEALQLADSTTVSIGNSASAAMTVAAGRPGGRALAFVANNNGTAHDWTGGIEVYDEDVQTNKFVSAALGDIGPDGRASLSANRVSGTGQMAGLMIAL